jgi:hypothetical protein
VWFQIIDTLGIKMREKNNCIKCVYELPSAIQRFSMGFLSPETEMAFQWGF